MKTIKSFSKNTILNFASNIAITFVMQLFFMPFLSDSFTVSDFGNIIFTLGVLNLITAIFSASMSNYRLKLGRDIDDSKSLNDFFILFLMALIVALPIAIIVTFLADIFNELFLLYCALLMFRVFGTSFLRLKLDYNSIAVISFLLAGTILFASWFSESDLNSKNWPLLLIIPEVFASIYLNFKIKIFSIKRFREVSNINILRKTLRMHLKSYFFFMFLQLAESSFTYIDRVILKFGFGSEMVADFFILTSLAKFQPVIFNMISGVLLSYLAFSNENLWLKHKIKLLAVIPAISIMSIVTILIFDDLFIHKFYPKTSLEGSSLILLMASILFCLIGVDKIFRSFLIKYVKIKFLAIKEFVLLIITVIVSIIIIKFEGGVMAVLMLLTIVSILRVIISLRLLKI